VFEGIDWTGNVAVTSSTGRFSMSDTSVYAGLGVRCANSVANCRQTVSNSSWFSDLSLVPLDLATTGVFNVTPGTLVNEQLLLQLVLDVSESLGTETLLADVPQGGDRRPATERARLGRGAPRGDIHRADPSPARPHRRRRARKCSRERRAAGCGA
jgi:hypothetical protein